MPNIVDQVRMCHFPYYTLSNPNNAAYSTFLHWHINIAENISLVELEN